MKKLFLSFVTLVLFSCPAWGETGALPLDQDLFDQASAAYYQNDLDTAKKLYETLLSKNSASGDLWYNLGNIYYRRGDLGRSLLYYEKANRLIPRDTDLRANLRFVQNKRTDLFSSDSLLEKILKGFFFWNKAYNFSEGVWLLAGLMALAWFFGLIYLIVRRQRLRQILTAQLMILVLFGFSLAFKYNQDVLKQWAIILEPEVPVRPTFMEEKQSLLKMHAGTKVEILDSQSFKGGETWLQIKLPKGQKGWILEKQIGKI